MLLAFQFDGLSIRKRNFYGGTASKKRRLCLGLDREGPRLSGTTGLSSLCGCAVDWPPASGGTGGTTIQSTAGVVVVHGCRSRIRLQGCSTRDAFLEGQERYLSVWQNGEAMN